MSELSVLTLKEAGDALATRELSSRELLDATLDRLRATEPTVHAYVTLMEDSARAQAAAADEELRQGRRRGALQGIPIAVKDLCYTAGVATQAGSRVLEGFTPAYDATVVARLKAAGAVIVGKTVTHEFAYGQNVPPTRCPWNTDCYPGGSSAGSGVAVAVGSAFAAIGTDTGGSVRIPAAVNGVVGIKPTNGLVSRHGVIPLSPTLDAVGVLARTSEDCALVLEAIAGHDADDGTSLWDSAADTRSRLEKDIAGVRLGLDREYFFYEHVDPEVRAATETAIDALASMGASIVDVHVPDLELTLAAGMTVLLAEASEWHRDLLRERTDRYEPGTRLMLELGELIPAAHYVHAQRSRALLRDRIRSTFTEHHLDCLIGPTLPTTTLPLEDLSTSLDGAGQTALSAFMHHCFVGNVVGLPALSFPCGFSSKDLPIGVQLYGRPLGEATLFQVAHAYQRGTAWHTRRPDLPNTRSVRAQVGKR